MNNPDANVEAMSELKQDDDDKTKQSTGTPTIAEIVKRKIQSQRLVETHEEADEEEEDEDDDDKHGDQREGGDNLALIESVIFTYDKLQEQQPSTPVQKLKRKKNNSSHGQVYYAEKSPRNSSLSATSTPISTRKASKQQQERVKKKSNEATNNDNCKNTNNYSNKPTPQNMDEILPKIQTTEKIKRTQMKQETDSLLDSPVINKIKDNDCTRELKGTTNHPISKGGEPHPSESSASVDHMNETQDLDNRDKHHSEKLQTPLKENNITISSPSSSSRRLSERKRKRDIRPYIPHVSDYTNENFVQRILLECMVKIRARVDHYGFFSRPVDPIEDQCSDYYDIIDKETEAMDLGTLEDYIKQGKVRTIQQVRKYLSRIVFCAQKYNTDTTNFVRQEADKILPETKRLLELAERKLEKRDHDDTKDEHSNVGDSDDDSKQQNLHRKKSPTSFDNLSQDQLIAELNKIKRGKKKIIEKTRHHKKDADIQRQTTTTNVRSNRLKTAKKTRQIGLSTSIELGIANHSLEQSDLGSIDSSDTNDKDDEYLASEIDADEDISLSSFSDSHSDSSPQISRNITKNSSRIRNQKQRRNSNSNNLLDKKQKRLKHKRSSKSKRVKSSKKNVLSKSQIVLLDLLGDVRTELDPDGYFSKPVKPTENKFKDYYDIIDKESEAMDLGTMENMIILGKITNFDEFGEMLSRITLCAIKYFDDPSNKIRKVAEKINLKGKALIGKAKLKLSKELINDTENVKKFRKSTKKKKHNNKEPKTGTSASVCTREKINVHDAPEDFTDGADISHCEKDLSNSIISKCTSREEWLSLCSEMVTVCNEAVRRSTLRNNPSASFFEKPLSEIYIRERLEYDTPLKGLIVKEKEEPNRLQGFIVTTKFIAYRKSFRWTVDAPAACVTPTDRRLHATDDGTLAHELQQVQRHGSDSRRGFLFHRVCELSFLGGLGCGSFLLEKTLSELKKSGKYDYIVLQSTKVAIPFYERFGFVRVGAVNRFQDNERMPELAYRHWSEIVNGEAVESSYMMARRINDEFSIRKAIPIRKEVTRSERKCEVQSALKSARSLLMATLSVRATGSSTYTNSYRELFTAAREFAISAGDLNLYDTIDRAIKEITKTTIGQSRIMLKDLFQITVKKAYPGTNQNMGVEHAANAVSHRFVTLKVIIKLNNTIYNPPKELSSTALIPFETVKNIKSNEELFWKQRIINVIVKSNDTYLVSNLFDDKNGSHNGLHVVPRRNKNLYAKLKMPPGRKNLDDLMEARKIALDNFQLLTLNSGRCCKQNQTVTDKKDSLVKPGDTIMLKVPAFDGSDLWISVEVERHCLKKERANDKQARFGNSFIVKFFESDGLKRLHRILDHWNRGVGREWCTMLDWHSFPVLPVEILDVLLLDCQAEYVNTDGKFINGLISCRVGGGLNSEPKWRLTCQQIISSPDCNRASVYEDLGPGALREAVRISDTQFKVAGEIVNNENLRKNMEINDTRVLPSESVTETECPPKETLKDTIEEASTSHKSQEKVESQNISKSLSNVADHLIPVHSDSFETSTVENQTRKEEDGTIEPSEKRKSRTRTISPIKSPMKLTSESTEDESDEWINQRIRAYDLSDKNILSSNELKAFQKDDRILYKTGIDERIPKQKTSCPFEKNMIEDESNRESLRGNQEMSSRRSSVQKCSSSTHSMGQVDETDSLQISITNFNAQSIISNTNENSATGKRKKETQDTSSSTDSTKKIKGKNTPNTCFRESEISPAKMLENNVKSCRTIKSGGCFIESETNQSDSNDLDASNSVHIRQLPNLRNRTFDAKISPSDGLEKGKKLTGTPSTKFSQQENIQSQELQKGFQIPCRPVEPEDNDKKLPLRRSTRLSLT